MKKTILFLVLVGVVVLMTSCGSKTTQTLNTGDANIKIETTGANAKDWCPAGMVWTHSVNTSLEVSEGEWRVVGIESSGTYAGLCHIKFTPTRKQYALGMKMDMWANEDGSKGFIEVDIGGKKMVQEIKNED